MRLLEFKTQPGTCEKHGTYQNREIFGRWLGCPICSEEKIAEINHRQAAADRQEALKRRLAAVRIPPMYQASRIETYRADSKDQEQARATFARYSQNFDRVLAKGAKLVAVGTTGTGKTHLACAVLTDLCCRGHRVRYATARDIVMEVRRSYGSGSEETDLDILTRYAGYDLLVLDEVGAGSGREHEQMVIADLICRRHDALRPLILISNFDEQSLRDCVGDRVWSRLNECGHLLHMAWADHRLQTTTK